MTQVKIRVFRGHTDSVNSCNYIDNDTKILSGSSDKSSRIWDIDTGELKHHYTGGHEGAISETSINDNSRRWEREYNLNIWSSTCLPLLSSFLFNPYEIKINFSNSAESIVGICWLQVYFHLRWLILKLYIYIWSTNWKKTSSVYTCSWCFNTACTDYL